MIYTTYFANIRNLPEGVVPIAICGKFPDFYRGLQYKKLAPKYDFFMKWKKDHDNEYYVKCFKEQVLSKLHPVKVKKELIELAGNKEIALVCYEKPTGFCHRHLVSEWFRNNNIPCEEWRCIV